MPNDLHETAPELIKILSVDSDNLEAMAGKGLADVIALQVLGGVTSNSHVVVIDDQLDVEALRNGQTGRLSIVTLLFSQIHV